MRSFLVSSFSSAVARLACALGLLFAMGCSQDEGEQCQVDSDCSGSLTCLRAPNSERGTCMKPGAKLDSGTPDAATTTKDASSLGSGEDGGQSDASAVAGGDAG